jgi:MFS superfamily sulfate permease-like transporter
MAPRAKDYIKSLPFDLPASIVVFLVALPLCLGVALASNAPLFSGIIAGITGGIVVGLFSRSHLSVSGPAAGLTAIVSAAILSMPTFEAFLVSVVYCGILQLGLGYMKAGIIGDYVPNSVIKGMLAAIGLILILKQFPHLVGYDKNFEGDETFLQGNNENTFTGIFHSLNFISTPAFIVGISCLLFYFAWEKFTLGKKGLIRIIPAPLLVVLFGVGLHQILMRGGFGFNVNPEHLVSLPVARSASEFFSFFSSPDWNMLLDKQVLITGVTLALVASLESLLSIEAVDDLDPFQRVSPTNRELKAQGMGNIVSGLLGGLPVTSVIVRSSANVNAGARTKMSTIYHGILLLVSVAFIPALLNMIPKAALAAVLIFTGYKLAKPSLFVAFYRKGWDQFLPLVITISAILFTDLLKGVIIGIGIGLFFVIRSNHRSSVMMVSDRDRFLFRLRKDVSFLNKPFVKSRLEQVPANSYVLIDASRADFIDSDVVETIRDFMLHAPLNGITVEWKGKQLL